jgi:hypothetical protein
MGDNVEPQTVTAKLPRLRCDPQDRHGPKKVPKRGLNNAFYSGHFDWSDLQRFNMVEAERPKQLRAGHLREGPFVREVGSKEFPAKWRSTIRRLKNQTATRFQCSSNLAIHCQKFRTGQMLENIKGDDRFERVI